MITSNQAISKGLGRWEYDYQRDIILLKEGAAHIYYNEYEEKQVNIGEFFRVLSAKSSQCLSHVLTQANTCENLFFQHVCCTDGQVKKVLVIILNNNAMSKNKYGLSVDVTKIL